MAQQSETEALARHEAGTQALRTVHCYGVDVGGDILRGYAAAFALALAAVIGREAALAHIHEQFGLISVPPRGGKPQLVVDNSEPSSAA